MTAIKNKKPQFRNGQNPLIGSKVREKPVATYQNYCFVSLFLP
jgi:hypothetical protein